MNIAKDFTPQEIEVRCEITQRIVEEIKKAHKKAPIDLFLSYFYNSHFDPNGFDEIHSLGIPTVNFYCNSIYQFGLVAEIAAKVNFAWHAERDARPLYLKVGANPIWVQMGADPATYYPVSNQKRQSRICFIGQRYADRDRWLAPLITQHIPIDVYGNGWPQPETKHSVVSLPTAPRDDAVFDAEYLGRKIQRPSSVTSYLNVMQENFEHQGLVQGMIRTWRQSKYRRGSRQLDAILAQAYQGYAGKLCETFAQYEVVLNFSNVWADGRPGSRLIPHVRLRDFEAPMCRTCYLTGHTNEIEEFYQIGKEIDTYSCSDELIDKIRFYLAHPSEAEALREAGYQRALRDHTWENRFRQLFKLIGLRG
jgi:spore maturation protein CgeB